MVDGVPLREFVDKVAVHESEAIKEKMETMRMSFLDATICCFDEYVDAQLSDESDQENLLERDLFIKMLNEGVD